MNYNKKINKKNKKKKKKKKKKKRKKEKKKKRKIVEEYNNITSFSILLVLYMDNNIKIKLKLKN